MLPDSDKKLSKQKTTRSTNNNASYDKWHKNYFRNINYLSYLRRCSLNYFYQNCLSNFWEMLKKLKKCSKLSKKKGGKDFN